MQRGPETKSATSHRSHASLSTQPVAMVDHRKRALTIATGGGKGGIGKSLISSSIALELAKKGKQVVLLDADLGGANLHTCLGIQPPQRTLGEFLQHKQVQLADIVTPTGIEHLGLIAGASDGFYAANPRPQEKERLLDAIATLDTDVIIVDLGAGTGHQIVDFFAMADRPLLTVVPEPTSIENAYRFIKMVCYRRLRQLVVPPALKADIDAILHGGKGLRTPAELLEAIERRDQALGQTARRLFHDTPFYLVVNQIRSQAEMKLGASIVDACRRFFGVQVQHIASIPYDDAVWQSVRRRRPVVLDVPDSPASVALRQLVVGLGLEGQE